LAQDEVIVLSVGRLHISKGYPILVEALACLQDTFPKLRLVIIGEEDHEANARPSIDVMAERYGISDRIALVGSQPHSVLVDWYAFAKGCCSPPRKAAAARRTS
jgi:glycosyltransferase involved in cell wall biosynthesis